MVVWMPNGASSGPSDSMKPSSPNFDAEYAVPNSKPERPARRRMTYRALLVDHMLFVTAYTFQCFTPGDSSRRRRPTKKPDPRWPCGLSMRTVA